MHRSRCMFFRATYSFYSLRYIVPSPSQFCFPHFFHVLLFFLPLGIPVALIFLPFIDLLFILLVMKFLVRNCTVFFFRHSPPPVYLALKGEYFARPSPSYPRRVHGNLMTSWLLKRLFFFANFRFVEPPVLDMASVVEDSSTRTPLIFVLSPGVVSHVLHESSFVTKFLLWGTPLSYIFNVTQFCYFCFLGSHQCFVTTCWEHWNVKSFPCPLFRSRPGTNCYANDQRRSQRCKLTSAPYNQIFIYNLAWVLKRC